MADVPFGDFGGSGIKQIIRGTITVTTGASGSFSNTATIASVNTAKSLITMLSSVGYSIGGSSGTNFLISARIDLTSSTQVTAYVSDLAGSSNNNITIGYQVVEYY